MSITAVAEDCDEHAMDSLLRDPSVVESLGGSLGSLDAEEQRQVAFLHQSVNATSAPSSSASAPQLCIVPTQAGDDALEAFGTTAIPVSPATSPNHRRDRLAEALKSLPSSSPIRGRSAHRRPLSRGAGGGGAGGGQGALRGLVPSYMLPTGRTRLGSPARTDPAVSTREVEDMFRESNLFSNVPQEDENHRLFELLRSKAEAARQLVLDADEMWKQRLADSLRVSIGALKRDHERERKEIKDEFESFQPNANLVELQTGNKLLVPRVKSKASGPTQEHRDYASRHVKAQSEHNITRFLVKRSTLLTRQQEQLEKMKNSLTDAHQRLERIKATQLETLTLAVSRVEKKVSHSDRLAEAVAPLIATQPKIRAKRSVLETLDCIRHSLRLVADLTSRIPQLYESVCIADGPIEMSLPTANFRPAAANFYPRSVLSGRSREELVRELSSFLPYGNKGHVTSRSPSREQSRERAREASPTNLPNLDQRPFSAPAGIFVRGTHQQNSTKKSVGGGKGRAKSAERTRGPKSAHAQSAPISWAGQALHDDAFAFDGQQQEQHEQELYRPSSPLEEYRKALQDKQAPKLGNSQQRESKAASRRRAAAAAASAAAAQAGKTWSSYLGEDQGQCPRCLETFYGEGVCLPSIVGPDAKIMKGFRQTQQALHQQMLSSSDTKRAVKRLLLEQQQVRRAQGRSPNDSQPFKFCSWECVKQHTVQNCSKNYIFHYQTIIDLAAGYIVGLDPPRL